MPEADPAAGTESPLGIRKLWAVFLAWNALSFLLFSLPYFAMEGGPRPFLIAQALVDLAALYALVGYVVHRPIRSLAFRIVILVLVLIFAIRATLTVFVVGPILLPWRGDSESFVTASLLFYGVPCQLLMALALFRDANTDWVYAQRSVR
jgi:hypothetical protein